MKYTCPVCGNNRLTSAPEDYSICPCCRTEFDVSDTYYSHAELRRAWIESGALWGIKYVPAPADWSPVVQLKNISYVCTSTDLRHIALARAMLSGVHGGYISCERNTIRVATVSPSLNLKYFGEQYRELITHVVAA